jgi:branched-chain amino acid transport system substrate-binding protein
MKRQPTAAVALVMLLGATIAGCGDDSPADDAMTPGADDGIVIGFANMEGGASALSLPEVRVGVEAAAAYVNDELGGVNGQPVEYLRCDTDGSPESSVECANQFVEADVAFVHQGVDLGSDAMLPILATADIPLVGHVAFGQAQQTDPDANAMSLGVATPAYSIAPLQLYADEGEESVTFFLTDLPTSHSLADDVLEPAAESVGIDLRVVFFDPAAPDWNVLVATAMADSPDVIGSPSASEPDCIGFVGALRSAGYDGGVFAGACSAFVDELGDQAVGVRTYADVWKPSDSEAAPASKRDEIETYVAAMEASGNEDAIDSFAMFWFADTVNLARILGTIDGPVDASSVQTALQSTVDFDAFLGPTIRCDGTAWPGENACGTSVVMYEVADDGTQRAITDDFLDLSDFAPR